LVLVKAAKHHMPVTLTITRADGSKQTATLKDEAEYFKAGGILPYVLAGMLKERAEKVA
jgi:aconitase A